MAISEEVKREIGQVRERTLAHLSACTDPLASPLLAFYFGLPRPGSIRRHPDAY